MRGGRSILAVLVAVSAVVSSCSKELMAGGERGEVTTRVNDEETGGAQSNLAGGRRLARALLPAGAAAQGTVRAALQLALIAPDGTADPIASSSAVEVAIGSSQGIEIGRDSVNAASYSAVRVTFSSVSAEITGGLLGGVPVVGMVTVEMAEPMTVDLPINLVVQPGSAHAVVLDLNASTWLAAVDPLTLKVPATSFRAALAVRTD